MYEKFNFKIYSKKFGMTEIKILSDKELKFYYFMINITVLIIITKYFIPDLFITFNITDIIS